VSEHVVSPGQLSGLRQFGLAAPAVLVSVQPLGLFGAGQADLDEVDRADEAVGDAGAASGHNGANPRGRAP
jgi:hypothetical protein